jgi:hypothetical protein
VASRTSSKTKRDLRWTAVFVFALLALVAMLLDMQAVAGAAITAGGAMGAWPRE